jgi:hypothetical protein
MKAAAISAFFNGALSPDPAIAGTAAAALRTAASVPLKSLRRLFGRFETVSSASDRAAAERAKEVNPPFNLNASVARAEKDRQTSLGESDRRIGFVREAIVKLFKKASRWCWQDNDFIYLFVKPMLPMFLGIKSIPPTIVSFSTYSKTIISFLSPLKIFCFDCWRHIQLRNEFSGHIMVIITLFGDQIRHIALVFSFRLQHSSLGANVGLARRA